MESEEVRAYSLFAVRSFVCPLFIAASLHLRRRRRLGACWVRARFPFVFPFVAFAPVGSFRFVFVFVFVASLRSTCFRFVFVSFHLFSSSCAFVPLFLRSLRFLALTFSLSSALLLFRPLHLRASASVPIVPIQILGTHELVARRTLNRL